MKGGSAYHDASKRALGWFWSGRLVGVVEVGEGLGGGGGELRRALEAGWMLRGSSLHQQAAWALRVAVRVVVRLCRRKPQAELPEAQSPWLVKVAGAGFAVGGNPHNPFSENEPALASSPYPGPASNA